MDPALEEKLRRGGAIVTSTAGGEAVRATLHMLDVPRVSRKERKEFLLKAFEQLQAELQNAGVVVDTTSVSVSGQTAEAVIPLQTYDSVASRRDLRVDPLVQRQVIG